PARTLRSRLPGHPLRRGVLGASRARSLRRALSVARQPYVRLPPGGMPQSRRYDSVPAVRGGAPELREAGLVRLAPQRHAPGLLGLRIEVVGQAGLLDPPARRGAELRAPQPTLLHEEDDLIDLDAEQLGDLRGREEARSHVGCFGHASIVP